MQHLWHYPCYVTIRDPKYICVGIERDHCWLVQLQPKKIINKSKILNRELIGYNYNEVSDEGKAIACDCKIIHINNEVFFIVYIE